MRVCLHLRDSIALCVLLFFCSMTPMSTYSIDMYGLLSFHCMHASLWVHIKSACIYAIQSVSSTVCVHPLLLYCCCMCACTMYINRYVICDDSIGICAYDFSLTSLRLHIHAYLHLRDSISICTLLSFHCMTCMNACVYVIQSAYVRIQSVWVYVIKALCFR